MVELVATAIITVSSILLFGYWFHCAILLLRGQCVPPEAAFSTPARDKVLANSAPPIQSAAGIS
jgi:hypothetical protein